MGIYVTDFQNINREKEALSIRIIAVRYYLSRICNIKTFAGRLPRCENRIIKYIIRNSLHVYMLCKRIFM